MDFQISKTRKDYDDDYNEMQPHKDAFKKRYDRVEVRTLYNEDDFDKKFGEREGLWRSKGVDHTKNKDGHIQRTHPNDCEDWFIAIGTMEELLSFADEHGDIIIKPEGKHYGLEIYNDYRE